MLAASWHPSHKIHIKFDTSCSQSYITGSELGLISDQQLDEREMSDHVACNKYRIVLFFFFPQMEENLLQKDSTDPTCYMVSFCAPRLNKTSFIP